MILYHHRRDSGFVGIQDLGTNVDIKGHADNSDGIISIPSRRQSRIFSMDLSFLGTEEDHDRVVNKYKQVSYYRSSQNHCISKFNVFVILILTYFCFMYNHCVRLLLWPNLTIWGAEATRHTKATLCIFKYRGCWLSMFRMTSKHSTKVLRLVCEASFQILITQKFYDVFWGMLSMIGEWCFRRWMDSK